MRIEFIERLKARYLGRSWMPCPNCGRMFGGHESLNGLILWDAANPGSGQLTCPHRRCRADVREKNRLVFATILSKAAACQKAESPPPAAYDLGNCALLVDFLEHSFAGCRFGEVKIDDLTASLKTVLAEARQTSGQLSARSSR